MFTLFFTASAGVCAYMASMHFSRARKSSGYTSDDATAWGTTFAVLTWIMLLIALIVHYWSG